MAEHVTDKVLAQYRQGKLDAAALSQLDKHMQTCAQCQTQLATHPQTAASLSALRTDLAASFTPNFTEADDGHLSYENLAAHVDRQLDPAARARADEHLRVCRTCTAELDDLRAFQATLAMPQPRTSWLTRWRESFVWQWGLPVATAAACLLAVWFGVRLWLRTTIQAPAQPEIVHAPSPTVAPEAWLVQLQDGAASITLDAQGQLRGLGALSATQQRLVKMALQSGKVGITAVPVGLKKSADVLLGQSDKAERFALLSPISKVVLAQRPTLRWQALPGASSYRVTIFTSDYEIAAQSAMLTATMWMPPALKRNQLYVWQVTATKDGKEIKAPVAPAPEARFKILSQGAADEIAAAQDSNLLLGLLYAQAGLYDEAERALQKLARQNPQAPLAQQLLKDVQVQRERAY